MSTPTYVSPTNNTTFSNLHVQQLLATHGITAVYQGSSIVSTTGAYQSRQSLANIQVDQLFTMSGTTIGRVEVPISIADQNGQDITVGLYANSGVLPTGSSIASTTIPREFMQAISAGSFPDYIPGITGPWSDSTQLETPTIGTGAFNYGFGTDGMVLIAAGGNQSGTSLANVSSYTINSGGTGAWQGQTVLPQLVQQPLVAVGHG